MKRKEYITLTPVENSTKLVVNGWMISSIKEMNNQTKVYTMDGNSFYVKEPISEILDLIDSTKNITLYNQ